MLFGFGVLRHTSKSFWAMTPRELKAALDGLYGRQQASLTQEALATLMQAFPDELQETPT